MLLDEGGVRFMGDPEEAARQYLVSNFEGSRLPSKQAKEFAALPPQDGGDEADVDLVPDLLIQARDGWVEGSHGERKSKLEPGETIRVRAIVEARRELVNPRFRLHVTQPDGHPLFAVRLTRDDEADVVVPAGRQIELVARLENPLLDGRYVVACWVTTPRGQRQVAQGVARVAEFSVAGGGVGEGILSVPGDLEVDLDPNGDQSR
jgi:Wzt-like putative exopolysaccharide export protein